MSRSVEARLYCDTWVMAGLDQWRSWWLPCPEHATCRVDYARRSDRFGRAISERRNEVPDLFIILKDEISDYQEATYKRAHELYRAQLFQGYQTYQRGSRRFSP